MCRTILFLIPFISLLIWPLTLEAQTRSAGSPGRSQEITVERRFAQLGLTVLETKSLDLATGEARTWAVHLDGRPADMQALEAAERSLLWRPETRIHPGLERQLERAGGAMVEVGVWFHFDPQAVDHRQHLVDRLAGGVPRDQARAELRALVAAGNRMVLDPAESAVKALGLPVLYADAFAPVIVTAGDESQLRMLAELPVVARIYPTLPGQRAVQSAVRAHRWDRVFDFGVRGDGVRIAIVEDGGISTNQTGINVVGTRNPGQNITDHATLVAGIAASDDATYPGHARGAEVLSANFLASPTWNAMMGAATWAINQGAEVLNMSWGGGGDLQLTIMDRYWDYQVRFNLVSVTVAAGNLGALNGNVIWPGLAWNVMTVGNVNDHGTANWSDDTVANDSSYKDPISAHGDREKPELCAIGSGITNVGPNGTLWNSHGTSNAAPGIAGMVACLIQVDGSLSAWPETVKAVMMASATNNVEGAGRLSDKDGAGCINGLQAYRVVDQAQFESNTFYSTSFSTNGYYTRNVFLQGGDESRVVLCWDSKAASSYATDVLEADLDLAILQGQNTTAGTVLASSSSWDNSYEIVEFCPPATGWYTIRVSKYRFDGASEPYGLAWTQHTDGRHARFRPRYPDVTATDETGPVIGNNNFRMDPSDPVNPGKVYLSVASFGTAVGLNFGGCRHLAMDFDWLTFMFLDPANPWFLDSLGTLDGSGTGTQTRLSIPDDPSLAGFPIQFGTLTFEPTATDGLDEISVVHEVVFEGHGPDLSLADDDSQAINIPFSFPFFGSTHTLCHVNSNGNITFNGGDTAYQETVNAFTTGNPRIAPFWDDLNPAAGGRVRVRSGLNRLIIEWVNVPEYGEVTENSVIVILHQSGRIEFKYRDCDLGDAIVGISPGGGASSYPVDISHGSRTPQNPGIYPAIYEHFSGSNVLDLGVADDHRNTVTFTPTNGGATNYRMTVDMF